ncbi:regulator of Vps4 activity in the MVB pathway-domain-containing protein [Pavlovales sp. CCMP2436]|nr:regulator of Vps4 activity in the MVB pathway-domain-containing protein [Pavlovales sp. CCMP2436]
MFTSAQPRFDANKCKVHLKMLANRFKLLEGKKANLNKQMQRAVAGLLREGKSESARIQTEHIIREDITIEVYEVLRQHVDILIARFAVIISEPEPRKEVQESVCTLIYAGWLLGSEIPELRALHEQFASKYGKPFAEEVTKNSSLYINPRVLKKLQHDIPDPALVDAVRSLDRVGPLWQPNRCELTTQ